MGPHLVGIGVVAGQRVSGNSTAQYLYKSILEPGAFITPDYATPSAMPPFGELLSQRQMSDLVAFLGQQLRALPITIGDSTACRSRDSALRTPHSAFPNFGVGKRGSRSAECGAQPYPRKFILDKVICMVEGRRHLRRGSNIRAMGKAKGIGSVERALG